MQGLEEVVRIFGINIKIADVFCSMRFILIACLVLSSVVYAQGPTTKLKLTLDSGKEIELESLGNENFPAEEIVLERTAEGYWMASSFSPIGIRGEGVSRAQLWGITTFGAPGFRATFIDAGRRQTILIFGPDAFGERDRFIDSKKKELLLGHFGVENVARIKGTIISGLVVASENSTIRLHGEVIYAPPGQMVIYAHEAAFLIVRYEDGTQEEYEIPQGTKIQGPFENPPSPAVVEPRPRRGANIMNRLRRLFIWGPFSGFHR